MALVYCDKGTSGPQIEVISHRLVIGHIGKDVLSALTSHAIQWRWFISIGSTPSGFQHSGFADTLDDAKAAVEWNWKVWLAAAGLTETQDRRAV